MEVVFFFLFFGYSVFELVNIGVIEVVGSYARGLFWHSMAEARC